MSPAWRPGVRDRWFPQRIEGSLAVGTRSVLVFPDQRVWWDVSVLESDRRLEFH